jgi:hypothetical protein
MGLNILLSRCSAGCTCGGHTPLAAPVPVTPTMPDPDNYQILSWAKFGTFLVVEVRYPDATNYEGHKILVFKDTSLEQIEAHGCVDPHFCESPEHPSPVARFVPTAEGLAMAKMFCVAMMPSSMEK